MTFRAYIEIWRCDIWWCEGCGTEIAVGYGQSPEWQDFQSLSPPEADVIVNDC